MLKKRESPIEISKEEFQKIGYQLIDKIADFIDVIHEKSVTPGDSPQLVQHILGSLPLPENGIPAEELINHAADLLMNHSLVKFFIKKM